MLPRILPLAILATLLLSAGSLAPPPLSRRALLSPLPLLVLPLPTSAAPVPMQSFVDPEQHLFSISVPSSFYTIRRKGYGAITGDLPDAGGNGRRGATIFTAGDYATASVVAVEKFPTSALLTDAGIDAAGDLSSFPAVGISAVKIAELLLARREKERGGQARSRTVLGGSPPPSFPSPATVEFSLTTEVEVQRPDMLKEQTGRSDLVRPTVAKAEIRGGDLYVVYASGLVDSWEGAQGEALREAVKSFKVLP